jgi:hypothetical protein
MRSLTMSVALDGLKIEVNPISPVEPIVLPFVVSPITCIASLTTDLTSQSTSRAT